MFDLHAKLYCDVSADDVETLGTLFALKSKTHHVDYIDQEERQAKDNGGQDFDFERAGKVQTSGYDSSRPY